MDYPKNNNKYSWKDLKEIGIIANKSYTFFDNVHETTEFFDKIEENVNIECLLNKDKSKQSIDLEVLPNDVGEFSKKVKYIKCKNTNAECFIFTYYESLIISFVGTNSITDWEYDFKLDKERIFLNGKFCDIHRGFYEEYYSIKDDILTLCKGYCNNNLKPHVLIIGHSLGVIGQLCGFDISNFSSDNVTDIALDFISFGAPCVGNSDFVKLVDNIYDNNIRLVNNEDLVPVFLELCGYEHSGNIIMFKDNDNNINDNVIYEKNNTWSNLQNIFFGIIKNWIPFFGINIILHHLMDDYIYRIEEHIKKI